jgi:hypothetical protein
MQGDAYETLSEILLMLSVMSTKRECEVFWL